MRIAMLSWRSPAHPQAGGAETLTNEILKRAVARGHEATWFSASFPGGSPGETNGGIEFIRRGSQSTVHFHAWRWLRHSLDRFDVIVDQVNTIPFLTPLFVREPLRRLFIFQTAREYWWRQTKGAFRLLAPLGYLAEPLYLRIYRSTRTITISDSTRAELTGFGLPSERIRVIPVAFTGPALDSLGDKAFPFRIIVVGRLTPAKYVEEAISAFARVHSAIPDSYLDIAGSGELRYRQKLERAISKHRLEGFVSFHGRVLEDRKRELLERAHVHLFTSHREGWGLTVNEAGASGTPTVGFNVPGVRDSVRDPRLLCDLRAGPRAIADAIIALHDDPLLYSEVREEAWRFARSLSYEETADAFLDDLQS